MAVFTGKTVAEALQNGLQTLKLNRNEVKINVLKNASRGFLGINRHEAQVEVKAILPQHTGGATLHPELLKQLNVEEEKKQLTDNLGGINEESILEDEDTQVSPAEIKRREEANLAKITQMAEMAANYLSDVLTGMKLKAEPVVEVNGHSVKINLQTDQPAKVIGRHGMTINALQSMAQTFMSLHGVSKVNLILDTNGYRKRRSTVLVEVAKRAATEVVASGNAVYLDAMPANERKQLHQLLEDNQFVRTYSHGREPRRSVVVAPANER